MDISNHSMPSPTKKLHTLDINNDHLSEGELLPSKDTHESIVSNNKIENLNQDCNTSSVQPSQNNASSTWGSVNIQPPPQTSPWGEQPVIQTQANTSQWGEVSQPNVNTSSASTWGQPAANNQPVTTNGWGDSATVVTQPQVSSWGDPQPTEQTTNGSSWDSAPVQSSSSWGDTGQSFGGGGASNDNGQRGERRGGRGGGRGGGFGGGGNRNNNEFEVVVKGLLPDTSENDLYDYFEYCGKVLNVKLLKNPEGQSKQMAFVKFETEEVMNFALSFNGDTCNGVTFKIERSKAREPRQNGDGNQSGFGNGNGGNSGFGNGERRPPRDRNAEQFTAFVGSLSFKSTENSVKQFFSDCGNVLEVRFMKNEEGKSKGFGYVEFDSAESLQKAVAKSGQSLDGRSIKVDTATKKGGKREGGSQFNSNQTQAEGETTISGW